jgi:hypothetical protein
MVTVDAVPGKPFIPAPHGRLEALLQGPAHPHAAAVVCHPHPLFGGTMHNNVVYRMARALERHGLATLRFNFRGVGLSTGRHDEGVGEQDDVRAALAFLASERPGVPLWLAGFSFGARVGLAVGAEDDRVGRLLGVGLVPKLFDFSFLERCAKPKAFVCAGADELADAASVRAVLDAAAPPKHVIVVEGARHLYAGKLDELERAVDEAIAFLGDG